MAVTRGCFGKVFAKLATTTGAASQIAQTRDWQYEETAERNDSTVIGDCTKSFVVGAQETSGQLDCFWDVTSLSAGHEFRHSGTSRQ